MEQPFEIDLLRELKRTTQDDDRLDYEAHLSEQLTDAAKKVEALLQPLDERAQSILRPWLMNPLRIGTP